MPRARYKRCYLATQVFERTETPVAIENLCFSDLPLFWRKLLEPLHNGARPLGSGEGRAPEIARNQAVVLGDEIFIGDLIVLVGEINGGHAL